MKCLTGQGRRDRRDQRRHPLWAALACRLAEALQKPLGLLSTAIYAGLIPGEVTAGFRDIQVGDNGA
jgi:kumamolisin